VVPATIVETVRTDRAPGVREVGSGGGARRGRWLDPVTSPLFPMLEVDLQSMRNRLPGAATGP
jgi:hypothetical protein